MKNRLLSLCLVIFLFLNLLTSCSPASDPQITVSASDLWAAFVADTDAAKNRYHDAAITVTGEISEISEDFMGLPCIVLDHGAEAIPSGIFCFFPSESIDAVLSHSIGDLVSVSGTCSAGTMLYGEGPGMISINDAMFDT